MFAGRRTWPVGRHTCGGGDEAGVRLLNVDGGWHESCLKVGRAPDGPASELLEAETALALVFGGVPGAGRTR